MRAQFPTLLGQEYRIDIDDANYGGSPLEIDVDSKGFSLRWDGETDSVNPGVVGSGCGVSILVTPDNATEIDSFATDLISSEETRFTIAVYQISAGPTVALKWVGYVVPDLGAFDDIGTSYFFSIKAVDGLARLKSEEYKDTAPTPDAPFGSLTFLNHLLECLGSVGTEAYWGGSEVWLCTVVNWQEAGMPAPAAASDPLAYSRVSGEVFAKQKNNTNDVGWEYFSRFKVLEELCRHWNARLLLSDGAWRFEQIRERMEEDFFERRYSTAGTLLSSTNAATADAAVLQSGNDHRLRGGQFAYLPALRKVRVNYDHQTYVNRIQGQDYRWQKDSQYSSLVYSVTGLTFDSDTFFKVSGLLNVNASISSYTKPWRIVFGVLLRLPEQPYRLKSNTTITQLSPNAPIYSINQEPPTWDDSGGGYYYEISTQVITSSSYKDSIPFSFWTPFIPSGEKGFEINFAGLIRAELVDGDPVTPTYHDWSFKNVVLTFNGLDTAGNFEVERIYSAENTQVGNSDSLTIDTIFGHAVKAWTPRRIEVNNGVHADWTNATATWDRGSETSNREFGQLLANQLLAIQQTPVQTYSGTLMSDVVKAHSRVVLPDDSTWLLVRAEFVPGLNQWSVEMLRTGIADDTDIESDTPIGIPGPDVGSDGNTFGLVVAPNGTGRMTSQADRGRQALALLTGNYVSTTIPAGTVTSIPVDLPIKANAYDDGDLIAIVDPQSGELIPFVVSGNQPGGATSITVVSKTIDYDIPVGAQVVYSPMNLLTEEGGDLQGIPAGTVQGEILRWNATDEAWEPYGAGTTDGHVLTWDATNGWQAEAPATSGGTVTSVGLSMPSGFSVGGSPVTGAGTLSVTTALNGPIRGNGSGFTTGNINLGSEVSGTLPAANGGTGLSALGGALQLLRVNAGGTALEYFTPTYLTANQTITLSGDVTGSGSTAIAATIAANAVTDAKLRQSAGLSVIGRTTNTPGNVTDITAGSDGFVLRRSGTVLAFGQVETGGITNAAVTYAKIQNVTDNRLLGRSAGSAGTMQEITIGSGLSLSGGVLSASGSGVTGSGVANRLAIWSSTSALTSDDFPLYWDGTNNYLGVGTASPAARVHIAVPTGTNDEGLRILGNLSGNLNTTISNANNASAGANNIVNITTGGSSAGDPVLQFSISGAVTWSLGLDNSDSDIFKIGAGSVPGTSTAVRINATGNVAIGTTAMGPRVNISGTGTTSSSFALLVNNSSEGAILACRDDVRVGIATVVPTQELHVNGDVIARQYMNTSAPPTVAYGAGAGTSPSTVTLNGGVNYVNFQFTTGTSPSANSDIFTLTFNQSFPALPVCVITAKNAQTATDITKIFVQSVTASTATFRANGTLSASTTYYLNIHIGGV